MAHIIYDTREDRSISDAVFQAVVGKYSIKSPITLTKKQITHGDFVICNNGKIFAVVERKAMHDFQSSMISKRLDEQINSLLSMRIKYGCHVFLLLEGKCFQSQTTTYRGVEFGKLDAKRRSIMYRGVPVIYSRDVDYTMEQITLLAVDSYKHGGNNGNDSVDDDDIFLLSIPDEHKEEAQELCRRLRGLMAISPCDFIENIPAPMLQPKERSDAQQLLEMWCSMKYITIKTAPELMKHWSISEFVSTRPDISGVIIDSRKFGEKKMANVYANINQAAKVNILTCIKGVSKELATQLADYDFSNMPESVQYRKQNIKKVMTRVRLLLTMKLVGA